MQTDTNYIPRLKTLYAEAVKAKLADQFGYDNGMRVPKLRKIVLNTSIADAIQNVKVLEEAAENLTLIAGQKAVITRARKSIANFKLREGVPIGARVTLRGNRMWEFLDRLITVAIPRIRDFRGVSPRSFDGRGNYTLGLKEQIVFPEINYDNVSQIHGLNVTLVTSAETDEEGRALLAHLGMPFAQA